MTENYPAPPRPKSKLVASEPAPAKKPAPKKSVPQRNGRAKMAREIMARFR